MRSAEEPIVPDILADANAVLGDKAKWRTASGGPPDYTKADANYKAEKTVDWAPGSLEDMVSNLVKNWEKEASYKASFHALGKHLSSQASLFVYCRLARCRAFASRNPRGLPKRRRLACSPVSESGKMTCSWILRSGVRLTGRSIGSAAMAARSRAWMICCESGGHLQLLRNDFCSKPQIFWRPFDLCLCRTYNALIGETELYSAKNTGDIVILTCKSNSKQRSNSVTEKLLSKNALPALCRFRDVP